MDQPSERQALLQASSELELAELADVIQELTNLRPGLQELLLARWGIVHSLAASNFRKMLQADFKLQVKAYRAFSGELITEVDLGIKDTIDSVRQAIACHIGTPRAPLKLICEGHILDDPSDLATVHLWNGAAVQVVSSRTLSTWDARLLSRHVLVFNEGLSARHTDPSGLELYGVVFGDAPLPSFDNVGVYFEVVIDEVRHHQEDGLAIGVTAEQPYPSEDYCSWYQPSTADDISSSWSLGYDGMAHVDGMPRAPHKWRSKDLQIGDHVGCLVSDHNEMKIYVNGFMEALLPGTVTAGRPLYGFVDLLGSAMAITLIPGASPPVPCPVS